jgi:uncharacterized membrane protein
MKLALKILLAFSLSIYIQVTFAKDGEICKTATGISFINGGISEEQADDIRRLAKHFSLQVLFSGGPAGGWLTDVNFTILDEKGKTVLNKKQSGPLIYINLPAGNYQIIGLYNSVKQSVHVKLSSDKQQRVILNWKDELSDLEPVLNNDEE